jgi:hypothetical protein
MHRQDRMRFPGCMTGEKDDTVSTGVQGRPINVYKPFIELPMDVLVLLDWLLNQQFPYFLVNQAPGRIRPGADQEYLQRDIAIIHRDFIRCN